MLPLISPSLDGNELLYLTDCIQNGWVSSKGPYVKRFEDAVKDWSGAGYAVAVSSGTNALHLALQILGIHSRDEVIVPALSYVACANVVKYVGAHPVFIDADPLTWNLDINAIESKITPYTRAIIAVHLYGHTLEMKPILEIAKNHHLWVVEDACEAQGSRYQGQFAGCIGDVGCYSFFANKLITTGEGGMLLTNSKVWAEKARSLRNQAAVNGSYHHDQIGFSYRMSNLQAAVGLAQMERIEQFITARHRINELYNKYLANTDIVQLYHQLIWSDDLCWLYSVLVNEGNGLNRDGLIGHLTENGMESKPFFEPLPSLPHIQCDQHFPVAESLSHKGISLPSSMSLTEQDIIQIADVIRQYGIRKNSFK